MKKYLLSSTIRPLEYQFRVSRDTKGQDAVVGVLSSLKKAGANVHEEFNAEFMYGLPSGYSGPES